MHPLPPSLTALPAMSVCREPHAPRSAGQWSVSPDVHLDVLELHAQRLCADHGQGRIGALTDLLGADMQFYGSVVIDGDDRGGEGVGRVEPVEDTAGHEAAGGDADRPVFRELALWP